MITYRAAYIGDANADILYQKAQEYFKEKNLSDKEFKFEFEDISNLSPLEISSKAYHMVSFDMTILDTDKAATFKNLMNSVGEISDLDMFPVARTAITEKEIQEVSRKVQELSGQEDMRVIPINISDEKDIQGYLDVIDISSEKYRELTGNILEQRRELRDITKTKVLEATRRKDEIDGNQYVTYDHVTAVGKCAKAFAEFLEFSPDSVENMEFIGYVHDTAKIAIPHNVVNAPRLTISNEVQQMEPHDELGGYIINSKVVTEEQAKGIVGHHGKREPEADSKKVTNLTNRYADVITIIDSGDAMTSQRAYNNPQNIVGFLEQLESCSRVPNWKGEIQFQNRELAEQYIIFNAVELGKLGYDVKAMIEFTLKDKQNQLQVALQSGDDFKIKKAQEAVQNSKQLIELLENYKDKIEINQNPRGDATTALGYKLTDEGYLDYVDKTLKHDVNIRVNSEFEFKVKMFFQKEHKDELAKAQDIAILTEKYVAMNGGIKEETPLWKSATKQVENKDNYGKQVVQAGRVQSREENPRRFIQLGPEILNAAKQNHEDYNLEQSQKAIVAIKNITREKEMSTEIERGS